MLTAATFGITAAGLEGWKSQCLSWPVQQYNDVTVVNRDLVDTLRQQLQQQQLQLQQLPQQQLQLQQLQQQQQQLQQLQQCIPYSCQYTSEKARLR